MPDNKNNNMKRSAKKSREELIKNVESSVDTGGKRVTRLNEKKNENSLNQSTAKSAAVSMFKPDKKAERKPVDKKNQKLAKPYKEPKRDEISRSYYVWSLVAAMVVTLVVGLLVGTKLGERVAPIAPNLSVRDQTTRTFKLKDSSTPDFSFLNDKNQIKADKDGNVIGNSFHVVDNKTGVEYIVTNNGGITPRLNHQGKPMIAKTK